MANLTHALRLDLRRIGTLVLKNLRIALFRPWASTFLRAFLLPVAYIVFMYVFVLVFLVCILFASSHTNHSPALLRKISFSRRRAWALVPQLPSCRLSPPWP
jgi:hypothetical protein